MNGKIEYGFGRDYLPNWTLTEALREVFQNYIDYGEYKIKSFPTRNTDIIRITVSNNYIPNKLEFLRIGNTDKGDNSEAIGHHGEGLKVAFLIFLREGLFFRIRSKFITLDPNWSTDELIGETLRIDYNDRLSSFNTFTTTFNIPKDIYNNL